MGNGPEGNRDNSDNTARTTEPESDEAAGTARGIGAPVPAAEGEPAPAASTSSSTATRAVPASSSSASSASASSASASAPAPRTVSTADASPDAATAAAAGSGGAGTGSNTGDEPPGSRPRKPMLAAAGIVGALLIAVPLLLAGQDDRDPEGPRTENAAGTVLDTARSGAPDTYTSQSPSPSARPSKKAQEKDKDKVSGPVVSNQTGGSSSGGSGSTPEADKKTDTQKLAAAEKKKSVATEMTGAEKLRQWANGRSGVQNTVLKNAGTGLCVDIGGYGKGSLNAPVTQYPCNNTNGDNQLWNLDIVAKSGGPQNAPVFLIRNSKDGLCLDLGEYTARPADTKVSEFHCNSTGDNQLWWLDPRGDGTNWIRNVVSNDLCLRPTGGSGAGADARLVIAACGFGDRWIV
ncbi:RICIN domain-containing protein [Streptomyces sp. NPDC058637]|uniref:RICIN domain-containing protein n=1 Tax=Streptomyces sp. NPDC058637 TaxID=3346569 RepID=UPI0036499A71